MSDGTKKVIQVEGACKTYRVPESGHRNLRGSLSLFWNVLKKNSTAVPRGYYLFHALQPVDFSISRGESVGIIGKNGSGKSTLLQLIAGTLAPSAGNVQTFGSVSALLELGSGFAVEYTGIENVYLNGAILGLSKQSIDEKLPDILEFADIGQFVHQPIKTYSSGMRIRLAFAVLASVRPEILIIDEALSVGDAFFQSKCVRWLEQYLESGGSLICVSHDMFLLQRICHRGIVLDKGEMLLDGPMAKAATLYYKLIQEEKSALKNKAVSTVAESHTEGKGFGDIDFRTSDRSGSRELEIIAIRSNMDLQKDCFVGEWIRFEIDFVAHEEVAQAEVGIGFRDRSGQLVMGYHTHFASDKLPRLKAGRTYSASVEIRLQIKPRMYLLIVGLGLICGKEEWVDYDTLWDCSRVIVHGEREFWGLAPAPVRLFNFTEKEPAG